MEIEKPANLLSELLSGIMENAKEYNEFIHANLIRVRKYFRFILIMYNWTILNDNRNERHFLLL